MSKKSKKVEEKKALTPIKKLTPIAKADESMKAKQAAAIAELAAKSKGAAPIEVPVVAAPVRPEMPANFCMEKADWDGAGVCYDAGSNNCGTCTKDFPETVAVCIERMKFLGGVVKAAKVKKSGTAKVRVPKVGGARPQCLVIDDLLRASTAMADMVASFATTAYAGDAKASERRLNRHLKSIRVGEYVRSAEMIPHIAYLTVAAPAAPAA
jgi:hypothetical protein